MPATKIKVRRIDLIAAIQRRKEDAKATLMQKHQENEAKKAAYHDNARQVFRKALAAVEDGKFVTFDAKPYAACNVRDDIVYLGCELPYPPKQDNEVPKFDGSRFDRDIAVLEMSPEDIINITADDFGHYVR